MSVASSFTPMSSPNKALVKSKARQSTASSLSDTLVRKLRSDYEEARARAARFQPQKDLAIHLRIHHQLANRVYSALASLLYASISMTKVDELERFVLRRASGLPKNMFDLAEWADAIDVAKQCRQRNFERIEAMSSPHKTRGLLRDDVTIESSLFEASYMHMGAGNNADDAAPFHYARRASDPAAMQGSMRSITEDGDEYGKDSPESPSPFSPDFRESEHNMIQNSPHMPEDAASSSGGGGRATLELMENIRGSMAYSNMGTANRLTSGAIATDLKDFGGFLRTASTQLEEAVESVAHREMGLEKTVAQLKADVESEREQRIALETRIAALLAAGAADNGSGEEGGSTAVAVLQREMEGLRRQMVEERSDGSKREEALQNAIKEERKKCMRLEKERDGAVGDCDAMRRALDSSKDDLVRVQADLTHVVVAKEKAETEFASATVLMKEQDRGRAMWDQERRALEAKIEELEAMVSKLKDTASTKGSSEMARGLVSMAVDKIRDQSAFDSVQVELDQANATIKNLEAEVHGAQCRSIDKVDSNAALKNGLDRLSTEKANLEGQVRQLKSELMRERERGAVAQAQAQAQTALVPRVSGASGSDATQREVELQMQADGLRESLRRKDAALELLAQTVHAAGAAAAQAQAATQAVMSATSEPGEANNVALSAERRQLNLLRKEWEVREGALRSEVAELEQRLRESGESVYRLSAKLKQARSGGSPAKSAKSVPLPQRAPSDEATVLMMQCAARRYLASKRVAGIKAGLIANFNNTILALPGTVQGQTGWYKHGDELYYFVVVGDGPEDFRLLSGPMPRDTVDEAAHETCMDLERGEGWNFDGHASVNASTRLPRDVMVDRLAIEATRLSIQQLHNRVDFLEAELAVAHKNTSMGSGGMEKGALLRLPSSSPRGRTGRPSDAAAHISMPALTPRSTEKVVRLQARARGFLAKASVGRKKIELAAQHMGVLIAMRNTTQGSSGWYGAPDGQVYYMVVGENGWDVKCGPISTIIFEELQRDCASIKVSKRRVSQTAPFSDPCDILRKVAFERTEVEEGDTGGKADAFLAASKKSQRLFWCEPLN